VNTIGGERQQSLKGLRLSQKTKRKRIHKRKENLQNLLIIKLFPNDCFERRNSFSVVLAKNEEKINNPK
jgi:hypothetical protein